MFSKTHTIKLKNISQSIYRELYRLNRSTRKDNHHWVMRQELALQRKNLSQKEPYIHYMYDSEDNIAAWALCFYLKNRYKTYFYVRKKHRRKGLGTRLVKTNKRFIKSKKLRTPNFSPHDKVSRAFFNNIV